MENLPLENYQLQDKFSFLSRAKNNQKIEDISHENQSEKFNSNVQYCNLIKQIKSDLVFLKNSTDKEDSIILISDLQKCYSKSVILNQSNVDTDIPISDILFDLLLNELIMKSDLDFLYSLLKLFLTLINVYQNSVVTLLLQPDFIENILSLFALPLPIEICNLSLDFLFCILNWNKDSIDQSTFIFDNLYLTIFNETQKRGIGNDIFVIKLFLKYLEKLIIFQTKFTCYKAQEISQFINYIFKRQDLQLLFRPIIEILILLIDTCFDTFSLSLPFVPALTIIINIWDNEKNISYQSLYLRFIEKVAYHKFPFESVNQSNTSVLSQICNLVSFHWMNSTIEEIIKLSLKATLTLILNYNESVTLFMKLQIIQHMIRIFQSDPIFEIRQLTGLIVFRIIFLNFDVAESNFDDIYEIFEEFKDTKLISNEVTDILQQRFDKCLSNI